MFLPSKRWRVKCRLKRPTGSSKLDHGTMIPTTWSLWTNPNVWTLQFWNLSHLNMNKYCLCNPSIWKWHPWLMVLSSMTSNPLNKTWLLYVWYLCANDPVTIFSNNSTFVFLVLCLQFGIFSDDKCPLMMQNELYRPTSLLHRSPVSYFWLWSNSTPKIFLQFFPFLVTRCFCCRNFLSLKHRNKIVNQIVVLWWTVSVLAKHCVSQFQLRMAVPQMSER